MRQGILQVIRPFHLLMLFQCVERGFLSKVSTRDPGYNNLIARYIPSYTSSSRSTIDCYIRCMRENCPSYFYNALDKRCQINMGIVDIFTLLHYELGCQLFRIPVDGQWATWSVWSTFTTCSQTCGGGDQMRDRSRDCADPPPQNGGLTCHGAALETETQSCQTQPCPIDGQWTVWSLWTTFTTCSKTCGGGDQMRDRSRDCTNPPPQNGGLQCQGSDLETETQHCQTQPCPVDGGWTDWTAWAPSTTCTKTCDSGTWDHSRSRTCTNPQPQNGGADCPGQYQAFETRWCNQQACPPSCPSYYEEHVSAEICFKYYTSSDGHSYNAKKQKCQIDGGNLAKVDTLQKHNAIVDYLETITHNQFVVIQGQESSGSYRYDDGTVLSYTYWDGGQPSNEPYISITYQRSYKWHDLTGQISSADFICELPM